VNHWSDEETDNQLRADDRNFYKVEKWWRDGQRVERMLWAGIDKCAGGGRPTRVRFAPKATVSNPSATSRDVPVADVRCGMNFVLDRQPIGCIL
jgi:hypothetical protein